MAQGETSGSRSMLRPAAVELVTRQLDIDGAALAAAVATLNTAERQKAARLATAGLRRRYVATHATLRCLLGSRLGLPPQAVELACGRYGKPALAGACAAADLHFNLSHCDGLAVFAFAEGAEVGVDIERLRPMPMADHLVASFFSRREQAAYRALPARHKLLGFFNAWTRKEAFVKATGDGLRHPLDAFDVSLAPGTPARLQRVGRLGGEVCGWALHSFQPGPGFVGALVVGGQATPPAAWVH
ncbi:4'-phosphopantetheinyl transferase superfamily protein [Dechloromonas sp. XY25]|uniref:4'-phosphopantetheinyl transferase superfamily protein n=1 Tax=Dechloromonas hankyongensis TaxID=2908002 RepID=A0ABS9K643_9RHOO|nr:4'-phosphopantetheinyl transferase superfamily protein [Dechloromonas hankyongensis]MCG2578644.1 4'-phosphopantetheinyl transferase superfamily protein [Dechloromonas hankyongensis]